MAYVTEFDIYCNVKFGINLNVNLKGFYYEFRGSILIVVLNTIYFHLALVIVFAAT